MSYSSRDIALKVINDVIIDRKYLNLSIKNRIAGLSDPDKRFCVSLATFTVENLYYIDYILSHFVEKKVKNNIIKNILRIGVAQIYFMNSVPDHVAVNESVSLCSKAGKKGLTGFVNAVLRNIASNKGNIELPDRESDPVFYLSIKYSYPEWICRMFIEDYGYDFAAEILGYKKSEPMTGVRIRPGFHEHRDWVRGLYTENTYSIKGMQNPEEMKEYINGDIYVMNEASVLTVDAAGISPDDCVLDVCAAPGGKSLYSAELAKEVTACDKYEHRVELIKNNIERMGIGNITTVCADAAVYNNEFDGKFDIVICDVVCSALGLMYRKPDIKILRKEEDIYAITEQQKAILDTCKEYVRDGGVLLYSTCTIDKKENEEQVLEFLRLNHQFSLEGFSSRIDGHFEERADSGMLQIFPHEDGIDGFFIAKMRKK